MAFLFMDISVQVSIFLPEAKSLYVVIMSFICEVTQYTIPHPFLSNREGLVQQIYIYLTNVSRPDF